VYGDGVAAYPDRYAADTGGSSAILDWPSHNRERAAKIGNGLPMFTLSTNCAYVHAYELLSRMAASLGRPADPAWEEKDRRLRRAINGHFWDEERGTYITLLDPGGTDDRQEAIGLAFAVLFGVADQAKESSLFRRAVLTPAGIASLWPTYPRYAKLGGFGRHSGMVWHHAQAFWADAAAKTGHLDLFAYELSGLRRKRRCATESSAKYTIRSREKRAVAFRSVMVAGLWPGSPSSIKHGARPVICVSWFSI